MQAHKTVSREEWLEARRALLAKEKALLKAQDALRQRDAARCPGSRSRRTTCSRGRTARRRSPTCSPAAASSSSSTSCWARAGRKAASAARSAPTSIDGSVVHLINHDVMLVAVSRAPYPEIAAYHKRMGWHFKWVSSFGSDFNFDYHVSFTEADKAAGKAFYNFEAQPLHGRRDAGLSASSTRDEAGEIFHTYSVFARGTEQIGGVYGLLDVTPKGRNEPPGGNLTALGPPPRQI